VDFFTLEVSHPHVLRKPQIEICGQSLRTTASSSPDLPATDPPAARILGIDNLNQWASPSRYQNFSPSTEEKTNRSDSHALFIEETILGAYRELLASKDDRDAEL
jgi:hypothetical protein